jgi:hypothetical protein
MRYEHGDMHESWKVVHWIGLELCDLSRFDSVGPLHTLLSQMVELMHETQRIQSMDAIVKWNTCMLVDDALHKYIGMGSGGRIYQT